ncbi:MAG: DUF362 domain-containing protein [Deltaproteobacteria bacterium]|nr:DUF362 domain-containing protein [Deltaproteobacteria bacterium]
MVQNFVVVTKAKKLNYMNDYVALPKNYGSKKYFAREDVGAIDEAVFNNLNALNSRCGFANTIRGRKVLIKPNFVAIYHKCGYRDDDYPQSTDPRVLDAVVRYIKQFTGNITVIEGSGAPVTRLMAKMNGTDRLVKFHNIKFEAVEELPVDRYILPRAQVMKDVYIPRTFSEVVRGEAFYVSLPKMKTNLYTGVTLGFKNAMGCLSTHMRYRNHNYNIDKKLVDLLYLFKPDLTIIDGIIGAEGDVPAPVDPVEAGLIISGTNSVETDRVAARMMSHDPSQIRLMQEADKLGFNDPEVEVIGESDPIKWRPADKSLVTGRVPHNFPDTRFLVGASKHDAPVLTSPEEITLDKIVAMEQTCPGGCLPTIIMSFENFRYMKNFDPRKYRFTVLLGEGAKIGDTIYYFDKDCNAYSRDDILKLNEDIVAAGSCNKWMADETEYFADGCTAHIIKLNGHIARAAKSPNPFLKVMVKRPSYLWCLLKTMLVRIKMAKAGNLMDVDLCLEDQIFVARPLAKDEMNLDYISVEIPPLTKEQIKKQIYYITHPIPS